MHGSGRNLRRPDNDPQFINFPEKHTQAGGSWRLRSINGKLRFQKLHAACFAENFCIVLFFQHSQVSGVHRNEMTCSQPALPSVRCSPYLVLLDFSLTIQNTQTPESTAYKFLLVPLWSLQRFSRRVPSGLPRCGFQHIFEFG